MSKLTPQEHHALAKFEEDTGEEWKVIQPSQTKYYANHLGMLVWSFNVDGLGKKKLYVVPVKKPHYRDYQKILNSFKKKAFSIMPAVKIDADGFPSIKTYTILPNGKIILFEIKLSSDIIFKYAGSKNPLTYTPGKFINLKQSAKEEINEYLKKWDKISYRGVDSNGKFNLEISNSITNEYCDFDVTVSADTISAKVTPTPVNTIIDHDWEVEGQIDLTIEGKMIHNDEPPPQVEHSTEALSHELEHIGIYVLVGVGAVVLTFATLGSDIPVLAGVGAAGAAGAMSG